MVVVVVLVVVGVEGVGGEQPLNKVGTLHIKIQRLQQFFKGFGYGTIHK